MTPPRRPAPRHRSPAPPTAAGGAAWLPSLRRRVVAAATVAALIATAGLAGCAKRADAPAPPPAPPVAPFERGPDKDAAGAQAPTEAPAEATEARAAAAPVAEGGRWAWLEAEVPAEGDAPSTVRFGAAASGSASVGTPQDGHLLKGVHLPVEGESWLKPLPTSRKRDYLWGTAELVQILVDGARSVAEATAEPEARTPLRIGNLSAPGGGDIIYSVSHNSGRDADLCFFAKDRDGRPVDLERMARFDEAGTVAWPAELAGAAFFDTERNWLLVRALLTHPAVIVQWIFVAAPLRNMLLDHALRIGEPDLLRERARRVLVQPTDSKPHDDHFHVRIACPADDKPGCLDGAGRTALAREAQIDALLHMYHHGTPAEQRYARDFLRLPEGGEALQLPPMGEGGTEGGVEGGAEDGR